MDMFSVDAEALVIVGHFMHLHGQTFPNRETSASCLCQSLFCSLCLYLAHLVPKARWQALLKPCYT